MFFFSLILLVHVRKNNGIELDRAFFRGKATGNKQPETVKKETNQIPSGKVIKAIPHLKKHGLVNDYHRFLRGPGGILNLHAFLQRGSGSKHTNKHVEKPEESVILTLIIVVIIILTITV